MKLTKFIDKLPIPPVHRPKHRIGGIPYYEVRMKPFRQQLHSQLPPTALWGYEGRVPGPTFEVRQNERIMVKWINELPDRHFLPVDKTIHGSEPDLPEGRTVVHVHGGIQPPDSDGYPDAWFTRDYRQTGPFFKHPISHYPNRQRPALLWYHDHTVGITRLNLVAGLAGLYIIRNAHEDSLNLPKGVYEIPLLIQDRSFQEDGSLYYPSEPRVPVPGVHPSIAPEFVGDTILVNGKVWPYLEVEPRKYRFRILNGSNARFYNLQLPAGLPLYQIGTEGGLLEFPVQTNGILLAPAERADVILDFTYAKGQTITLTNDANTPFPSGDPVTEDTAQILQFRVTLPLAEPDASVIPPVLDSIQRITPVESVRTRNLLLTETKDRYGRPLLLLDKKHWFDPVTEDPHLGTTEIWNLVNLTKDAHPIHLHGVYFQILSRQPIDPVETEKTGSPVYTGPEQLPAPNERTWKETVRAEPEKVTRIIIPFENYAGRYVWHCHILEHEDNEMMRPYEILVRQKKPL